MQWVAAQSPYIVTGNVQVPAGSSLTIDPGVTVKYAGAFQIYVVGTLIANGTSGSPIVFGSTTPGTSSGATMLKFEGANLTNSQLSYVQFSDAFRALQVGGGGGEFNPGIACTGTLTVNQVSVSNAEVLTGGYQTTASLVLDHATLTNAKLTGQYPNSEPIALNNSTVTNSVIFSDDYNRGITLNTTTVSGGQLKMGGLSGSSLTLVNSSVTNAAIIATNNGFGPFTLTNSTLTNTTVSLPDARCAISGSTVSFGSGTTPSMLFASGAVTGSTFSGSGSGVGLAFASGGGDITVSTSSFSNFAVGLRFSGVRSYGTVTVQAGNQFSSNSTYNVENLTATAVSATGNNWGTTDPFLIAQKIYDRSDDLNKGAVTVVNPASLAITTHPTGGTFFPGNTVNLTVAASGTPTPAYQWYKNGALLGGATNATLSLVNVQAADAATYAATVTNSAGSLASNSAVVVIATTGPVNVSGIQNGAVRWTAALSPYIVTGDVQVPAGSSLTIDPGVTVKYAGAFQIYVVGTLTANGTSGSPIVFGSTTPGTSSGATMLKFEGANLTNSQLSYVQFSDAFRALQVGGGGGEFNPGIACTGTLTVNQVSVTNAEVLTGGYQTTASLVLDHASLTNAKLTGQYPNSEPIALNNSTATSSVIFSDDYNRGITLNTTTVSGGQLKMGGLSGSSLTLVNSSVTNAAIIATNNGFGPFTLTNSTLTNTTVSLPDARCAISGSTVTFGSGTTPSMLFASGTVTGSTFTGSGSGVGLAFASGGGDITVSTSSFSNFAVGLRLSGVRSYGTVTVQAGNQFSSNSTYNVENLTVTPVSAIGNNWGTTDPFLIAQKIYDRGDDLNKGALTVVNAAALAITTHPSGGTYPPGSTVSLTVAATGTPTPTYQWYKNGAPLGGATNATLSLANVQAVDAAAYAVAVTNSAGSLGSNSAVVALGTTGPVNVSGIQNGAVRWVAALSPYIVTGDVQVPAGSSLTIDPGVTVKYAGAFQIYVVGTLTANGTSGSPIVFGSTTPGTSSGATMLKFEGANLTNSQLSYVQFSDAFRALQVGGGGGEFNPGIACTGTLTVNQVSITNAEVLTGGYQTTASLVLDHAALTNAKLTGQYPNSEPIALNNSTVTNSVIFSDDYNRGITLNNTTVSGGQLKMGGLSGSSLTLVNSSVTNAAIIATNNGFGPFTLTNSTLTNTTVSLPDARCAISGSTVSFGSGTTPSMRFASGTVTGSTFTGSGSGVGLAFGSGAGDVTVSRSALSNFAVGLRFSGVRPSGTVSVRVNNLQQNATYHLENLTNTPITATANYWGTTDAGQIAQKIYDQSDDASVGLVTVGAILSGPVANPTMATQPASQTITAGNPVTFTVAVNSVGHPTYQWRKNGAEISGNASATTASLQIPVVHSTDAGSYDCVITDEVNSVTSSAAVLTFVKGVVPVTLGNLAAGYNRTPRAATATAPAVPTTPSTVAITVTYNGSTTAPTAAGSYTVVATVNDLNFTGTATDTLVISPAPLTVSGIGAANKTYDRSTTATLTTGGAALSGIVSGDTVTLNTGAATGAFDSKTVGTGKLVTVSGLALAGADAANYVITSPTVTANITPAALGVAGVSAANKTYDGTTTATLTTTGAAVSGVISGDAVSLDTAGTTGAFATSTVGTAKPVTVSGLVLGGSDAGNYVLTAPSLTAAISTKALTVTGLSALHKTYNATTTALLDTSAVALVGVISGDTVTFGSATASFDSPTSGMAKPVTVTGIVLNGASASNYVATPPTLTANILPALSSITLSGLATTFDGTPKSALVVTSPPGVGVVLAYAGSATPPTQAGSYAVVATVSDINFTGSAVGTLIIAKAPQTIALASGVVTVGTPTTLTATTPSGLPLVLTVVSGNATLSGQALTVNDGGPVVVRATQAGDANYLPASTEITVSAGKQNQTISFAALADLTSPADTAVALTATASSGLPVSFIVVSGPATLAGRNLTLTGAAGTVVVRASQAGDATFNAAADVERSFKVTSANSAPKITTQPRDVAVRADASATFTVTATGTPAPTFQWRKNGEPISGATAAAFALPSAKVGDAGSYDVVLTNSVGSVTSALARLTVTTTDTAPVITSQPRPQVALRGQGAAFSVVATGVPAPAYQWRKNGTAVSGATTATLLLANVQTADAGSYSVEVSNSAGAVVSAGATLRVLAQSYAGTYFGSIGSIGFFALQIREDNTGTFLGYLTNSRTPFVTRDVTVGDDGQFQFVVVADETAGIATAIDGHPVAAAPQSFSFSGVIGGNGQLSGSLGGSASASLGAQRSASGATDGIAGFYQATAPNSSATTYTIVSPAGQALVLTQTATGADAGTGTADSSGGIVVKTANNQNVSAAISTAASTIAVQLTSATGQTTQFSGAAESTLAAQRFVNVSTRANVTDAAVVITGLVVTGQDSKPMLLRAVGPTLSTFGVQGALAKPRLQLYSGSTLLQSNLGWGTAANSEEVAAGAARAGAFPLRTGSADSALMTTLAPGAYTLVVSSADGASGVALVEAYDLSSPGLGQKVVNLSTRALVGSGENLCIAGFVITGTVPKKILVRGVGPGLAAFGVTGALSRPQVTLYRESTVVGQNAGWSASPDAAQIGSAARQAGAFALTSNDDAALILSLAPGAYSVQLSGVGSASGIALVEVYELP